MACKGTALLYLLLPILQAPSFCEAFIETPTPIPLQCLHHVTGPMTSTSFQSKSDSRLTHDFYIDTTCFVKILTHVPMGTGGTFPGGKAGRGVTLTTHPHLLRRS
jgi:hypothetical protein